MLLDSASIREEQGEGEGEVRYLECHDFIKSCIVVFSAGMFTEMLHPRRRRESMDLDLRRAKTKLCQQQHNTTYENELL